MYHSERAGHPYKFIMDTNFLLERYGTVAAALLVGLVLGYLWRASVHHVERHVDDADSRRKRWRAHKRDYMPPVDEMDYSCEWEPNATGSLLFRQQFVPKGRKKKYGIIGICHGFGDHSNHYMLELAEKFCRAGFVVLTMDAEGHGLSDGLHAHVDDLQHIARDFSDFFLEVLEEQAGLHKLPFFVYGVSMGGAVAFNLCTSQLISKRIRGVILCAPMVKMSEKIKPPALVVALLRQVAKVIPLAPITPVPSILEKCMKDPVKLEKCYRDPIGYRGKPRLGTAIAMLTATEQIEARMSELSHSVLILHGAADEVTEPESSQVLFERCSSVDKKFNLYAGCWHDMLNGESEEQIAEIFNDITTWVRARC